MTLSKSNSYLYSFFLTIVLLPIIISFFILSVQPRSLLALSTNNNAEEIFSMKCSGCHVNGGNIIRRNKTLKMKALIKNGIDRPEEIARVAREGIGIMSGYDDILEEDEDILIANWVWERAQKAWIQE